MENVFGRQTEASIAVAFRAFDVVSVRYSRAIGSELDVLREVETDATVYLVPARPDTRWWRDLCDDPFVVCLIRGRVRFGTAIDGAPFPSALVYRGSRAAAFTRAAAKLGTLIRPYAGVAS